MAARTTISRAEVLTTFQVDGDRPGTSSSLCRLELQGTAAARGAPALCHPGPQFEVRPSVPRSAASHLECGGRPQQEGQAERVVSVLLRELAEARKDRAATATQLQAYKNDYLNLLRQQSTLQRRGAAGKHAPVRGDGIRVFRPPGVAPLPPHLAPARRPLPSAGAKQQVSVTKSQGCGGEEAARQLHQAEALASLHLDNADLRRQVVALEEQCRQLAQAQQASAAACPASPGPTRTTMMVSSPGQGGEQMDSLTVTVFEPPSCDADELWRQLSKLQRDNLKLLSKLKSAEAELANKSITARRWEEACDAQAAQVAALKVDLEQERRYHNQLEEVLKQAGSECSARNADVAALLAQLRSADQASAAARGEVASLRSQLVQVEGLLESAQEEAQGLKRALNTTSARLKASELVRRDARRERDELAAASERLQGDRQRGESEVLVLQAAVATLQQQLSNEAQRSAMLQEQVRMVEQQGRETEELLSEQLRTVQEERNACLAAATRADALLVKLGSHAWHLKGSSSDAAEGLAA